MRSPAAPAKPSIARLERMTNLSPVIVVRPLTDGRDGLLAYTALDRLADHCGAEQPWILVPTSQIGRIREVQPFDVIAFDLEVPTVQVVDGRLARDSSSPLPRYLQDAAEVFRAYANRLKRGQDDFDDLLVQGAEAGLTVAGKRVLIPTTSVTYCPTDDAPDDDVAEYDRYPGKLDSYHRISEYVGTWWETWRPGSRRTSRRSPRESRNWRRSAVCSRI